MEALITFKAGLCEYDTSVSPHRVVPKPTSGYVYLYEEDELTHFCWRHRSVPMTQPELDLVMVPADGQFKPYDKPEGDRNNTTDGRIFVLKFQSSTQRHFFWMQSKSQHPQGEKHFFSPRDLKIGSIVNSLLQGDAVNPLQEMQDFAQNEGGDRDDEDMEDAPPNQGDIQGNIGSGDPFIGDPGEEGEESREGGADGGRAAALAVQNFLRSMQGNPAVTNSQSQSHPHPHRNQIFTTLNDLLPPSTTIPWIDSLSPNSINSLLSHLPPVLILLSQESASTSTSTSTPSTTRAALDALSLEQKREILRKVLRSPQFSQSTASLTGALRDGGLPGVSEALGVRVREGGFSNGGVVPLGGGDAVEAFLDGLREGEEGKGEEGKGEERKGDEGGGTMETD